MDSTKTYIAIDLKSFYASVECVERGLDPLTTNLVVADAERTEKTICLAVSPSLKAYGISGRARLFEVKQRIKQVNAERMRKAPGCQLTGKSFSDVELKAHPEFAVSFEIAPPRMAHYIEYSSRIYSIYLRYIAPEDIHVYSIDEVFIDVSHYLFTYSMTARELAKMMILDILKETGITATAGIGTNLYLCKVAMDIVAKHVEPDSNGVRIAQLDEMSYRRQLWGHRPITDFWRVGKGYAKKLEQYNIFTMGDVARCSTYNEDLLYRLFGVNAELLIDHAWGWEPCTIDMIKQYKPENNSFCSGQVLQHAYDYQKARLVVHEMADTVALDLVDKRMVTDQLILTIGYDIESLNNPEIRKKYEAEITTDRYGRQVPKHAHGTVNLWKKTSSAKLITEKVLALFDRIVNPDLLIRRVTITTNHVIEESLAKESQPDYEQLDLFTDYTKIEKQRQEEEKQIAKERKMQEAMLEIKKKFGKNAILKGINLQEGATAKERNNQIGGHKA